MSMPSDHKALIFICTVAILGAGVRVARAGKRDAPQAQPALEQQMHSADSAATSQRARMSSKRNAFVRSSHDTSQAVDTTRSKRRRTKKSASDTAASRQPVGALDRPGYINGKLDLDVATAAQIDSLPNIGPTLAKRIALDRIHRGPFLTASGLRRVQGVGDNLLRTIDTLVTFSGTIRPPESNDTIITRRTNKRATKAN